jgi:hypothetical protein
MKEAKKVISKAERLRQANMEAMPDVKELVKKHGITRIQSCLSKLREFDKKARQAQQLREEADKLERELSDSPTKLRAAG